jgi:hypothetical protein
MKRIRVYCIRYGVVSSNYTISFKDLENITPPIENILSILGISANPYSYRYMDKDVNKWMKFKELVEFTFPDEYNILVVI